MSMATDVINWEQAFQDYLLLRHEDGTVYSYKDIAEKYHVSERQVEEHGAKEKWVAARERTAVIAREKAIKKAGNELAKINEMHAEVGRMMAGKGIEAISNKENPIVITSARDAREYVVDGIKLERKALGMDNDKNQININQNVTYVPADWIPKSWFTTEELKRGKEMADAQAAQKGDTNAGN